MKTKLILFAMFLSFSLFAQNYNDAFRLGQQDLDYDAKTLSLGNSTLGSYGNFSSALLNPGALATIKRDIFTMSFNSNGFENSVDFFNSKLTSDRNNGNVNQIGLIMPLPVRRGSAVLAFGYSQTNDYNSVLEFDGFNGNNNSMIQDLTSFDDDIAYELGLSYPIYDNDDNYLYDETNINGRLFQSGKIVEDGTMNNWVMSGAAEVAKNMFIGATLNIRSGEYKSNRTYQEDDGNNIYNGLLDPADSSTLGFNYFYLNDIINQEIHGWDLRIGMLYKANENLNFGATIKLPSYYTIEEKYSIYGESDFTQNYFIIDYPGDVNKYEIATPMEFSGGVSASFPFVTLNASGKYADYSQLEFTDGFSSDDLDLMNNEIKEVMESTINFNLGAEVTLPYPALKLRTGFIYNPSPYVGDEAEFDKKYFTAGVGFPIAKKLLFDFAYVYGWWKNYGDNYDVNVSRTYHDIKLDKLVFSVSYIFM